MHIAGIETVDTQLPAKADALPVAPQDERAEQKGQHEAGTAAKQAENEDGFIDFSVEEDTDDEISGGPERGAAGVRQKKAPAGHVDGARERGRDEAGAGDEFREEQSPGSTFHETQFRLADAGVGFERKLAEQLQDGAAPPAAEFVPDDVTAKGGADDEDQSEPEGVMAIADSGAHDEHDWIGRKRSAGLHGEDVAEHKCIAV